MEMLCIFINIQIACLTCRRNRTLNGVTAPVKLLAVRPCLLLLPYCIRTRIHTHNHIQADGLPFTAADSGRHVRPAVGRHVHFAWNSREFATKSQIQLALCAVVPHACLFLLLISDFEFCVAACRPLAALWFHLRLSSSCLALALHRIWCRFVFWNGKCCMQNMCNMRHVACQCFVPPILLLLLLDSYCWHCLLLFLLLSQW